MPCNGDWLSLRSIQQLPKTVLSFDGRHRDHYLHLEYLANMDGIASLLDLQLPVPPTSAVLSRKGRDTTNVRVWTAAPYRIGWRRIVFSFSGAVRLGSLR